MCIETFKGMRSSASELSRLLAAHLSFFFFIFVCFNTAVFDMTDPSVVGVQVVHFHAMAVQFQGGFLQLHDLTLVKR